MCIVVEKQLEKRPVIAWCLFDAANSAFATIVITFIFSVYFARSVVGDEVRGSELWGYMMAASGVLIALASPVVGAVADHYGPRKPGLMISSLVCVVCCALLYFIPPQASAFYIAAALALVCFANTGFEIALVFSNAMLPHLSPPHMMGRISGWAWASGYAGGLACLVLCLVLLVGVGSLSPLIHLPQAQQEHVRATAPLTALWFFALSLPLFIFASDMPRTGLGFRQAAAKGFRQIFEIFHHLRDYKDMALFLAGSAFYRDGLNTLFAMGGIFAAGAFGMNFTDILVFAIGINITAGIGAFLFSYLDDKWGSKETVLTSLAGLVVCATIILFLHDKNMFIAVSMIMGVFIGPAQAAGRTMAARLAPPGMVGQTYGFYSLTGRVASFLGPLLFGLATGFFESQKAGFATIILLWLVGMVMIYFVKIGRNENH